MSLKWPSKDPDETLDYSIDWSRFLGADTISTVTWYVEVDGVKTTWSVAQVLDGLQHVSSSNTDTVATIYLGLGTPNTAYKITCKIVTVGALTTERVVRIKVRDHY